MMFFQPLHTDERTRSSTRYAAAIWLGVTQVLLAGVVFYRLYVLGQPDEQIRDFQAVLAISIFGYLALQLFLGGVMPIPTWKGAITMYLILAGAIVTVCLLINGWPQASEWASTWLPSLLGPAILVGAYVLAAHLGHRRIERQLERMNQ
jgi:phosphoglycerol transferase MdoB-like AlkP superfamily enzyme